MYRTKQPKKVALSIHSYRSADKRACRELWRQLAEKHAEIYSDPRIARENVESFFDEHLERIGPTRIWVATVGSKVVGFVGLVVSGESAEDGEIEPLVVHKNYRGRGIGRSLADTAGREARRLGVKYITVRPVARNREALGFFREIGFDKIGRIELFIDLTAKKWEQSIELHGMSFEF